MTITIKNLDGTILVNRTISAISVDGKNYSITFMEATIESASFDTSSLYNVSFTGTSDLGISEDTVMIMGYVSYYYNASTSYSQDKEGNKVAVVSVNSNSIVLKKY